jgi:2-hydroxy-4-carboxymuconate semialdehyde hemiacetal dehydrogenase
VKVAMIGHGYVGSVHASQLVSEKWIELVAVFGVERDKTLEFASAYGIKHVSYSLKEAVSLAEAAIVCSPSPVHYQQARECLELGVHALVEMPPCETMQEAEALGELATKRSLAVQCAHTVRYLVPHIRIAESIRSGELGAVQGVNFVRHHKLKDRAWTDDALIHHSAHPIDLIINWFGGITPVGCVALPQARGAQTVSLLGRLPNGAPATISVTYASRLPHIRMLIVGDRHTVETDGFSYVHSDLDRLRLSIPENQSYEKAIHDQDVAFLRSCQGEKTGVNWQEAVTLLGILNDFWGLEKKP